MVKNLPLRKYWIVDYTSKELLLWLAGIFADLPTPDPPKCGHITFHSLEIIWEEALEQANEKMAAVTGDERVKVILQQEAVGWSDDWSVAYT